MSITKTAPANTAYLWAGHYTKKPDTIQLEMGDVTTYEPYSHQLYDLNLGKNLYNKDTIQSVLNGTNNNGDITSSTWTNGSWVETTITFAPIEIKKEITLSLEMRLTYGSTGTFSKVNDGVQNYTAISTPTINTTWQKYIYKYTPSSSYSINKVFIQMISINGAFEVKNIQLEYGSQATKYSDYFTPFELCKIGDYKDYLYNNGGKWFKHKAIEKTIISVASVKTNYTALDYAIINRESNDIDYNTYGTHKCYCDLGISTNKDNDTPYDNVFYLWKLEGKAALTSWWFGIPKNTSLADAQTLLNGGYIYYILATPIDTEITNSELLNQLNTIQALAKSYYGTTNIMITTENEQPTVKVQTLDKIGG